jgi:alkylhydroperoxidase family enzyme
VALINEAWYEWTHHAPILLEAGGFTEEMLQVVRRLDHAPGKGSLSERQWVALRYADAMTKDVKVDDALFDELKSVAGFTEKEIVELTATVAAYNCVSRFLVALDVGEMNGKVPE